MDQLALRMVERICVVLFAGLAIYLGYRLFIKVPQQQNSEGRFTFPHDISIVLMRVGPGIFFALFGAAVLTTSLFKGIESDSQKQVATVATEQKGPTVSTVSESSRFHGVSPLSAEKNSDKIADARLSLRKDIAILNTLPQHLRGDLQQPDRTQLNLAIPRIKFALMRAVWGPPSGNWGDPAAFEQWLESGEPSPAPPQLERAIDFYRYPKQEKR